MESRSYTGVDFALLGVAGVIAAIIFTAAWQVWYALSALGPLARPFSVGLWFTGSIIAAALIKKPGAAFLGETLGALIEAILPTPGGLWNLVYGILQGAFAELGYRILGYREWGVKAGILAGALAGIGELLASLIYYREFFEAVKEVGGEVGLTTPVLVLVYWLVANMFSGALYGGVAAAAVRAARE
ncbi:MAG: ECF transporter S component [Desulfurococcales archaeon]|nr:ECF transporter S component [Desulfurococcales archaeon]